MSYARPGVGGGQRNSSATVAVASSAPSKRGNTPNSASGTSISSQLRHGSVAPKGGHMVGNMAAGQSSKSMAALRSLELCDRLKHEIETITSEIGAHQVEREDYEKKFRQQLVEMDHIQHSLKQLQEAHVLMKQKYEDEIMRLRHKLEAHPHGQGSESEGRTPVSGPQGVSGGMAIGSTGSGQAHKSSPPGPLPPGGSGAPGGGHSLASPRKSGQPGPPGVGIPGLGRSMLGPPVSQNIGGGGGPGSQVLLPAMPRRPGQLDGDYSRGPGAMGPNGQTVEPMNKRPRLAEPSGSVGGGPGGSGVAVGGPGGGAGGVYLPPHGLHPPQGFGQSEDSQSKQPGGGGPGGVGAAASGGGAVGVGGPDGNQGKAGGKDGLRGGIPRSMAPSPGGVGGSLNVGHRRHRGPGDMGHHGRGPPGPAVGVVSLSGPSRPGAGGAGAGAGAGTGPGVSTAGEARAGGDVAGEGPGMVDIPDAIPAELNYQVRYEGDAAGVDPGGSSGLSVKLTKSQDLRSVVCCVRFSNDGTKIAAGSHSCVKVFDVSSFRQLYMCRKVLPDQGPSEADPYVRAVCFSPDGLSVVAGMEKNSAKVLVLGDGGAQQGAITLSGHESEVYSLDWVGNMIASGSGDGRIRLWDSTTGACQASLSDSAGPQHGVTSVVLKQDTKMVAAASIDRIVHVWSTQTHKLLHRLDGHTESVYAVTFSHDGNRLVSGGLDMSIKVWDLGPGSEGRLSPQAQTLPGGHSDYVLSVCFSEDGKYIISGSKDRSVTIWDARLMRKVATVTGFKNSVIGVSASPTSGTFATGSGDNLVCVWKYGAGSPVSNSSFSKSLKSVSSLTGSVMGSSDRDGNMDTSHHHEGAVDMNDGAVGGRGMGDGDVEPGSRGRGDQRKHHQPQGQGQSRVEDGCVGSRSERRDDGREEGGGRGSSRNISGATRDKVLGVKTESKHPDQGIGGGIGNDSISNASSREGGGGGGGPASQHPASGMREPLSGPSGGGGVLELRSEDARIGGDRGHGDRGQSSREDRRRGGIVGIGDASVPLKRGGNEGSGGEGGVGGGGVGGGGGAPGGAGGSNARRPSSVSPERRSLPPKKDIQRRDSPPATEA